MPEEGAIIVGEIVQLHPAQPAEPASRREKLERAGNRFPSSFVRFAAKRLYHLVQEQEAGFASRLCQEAFNSAPEDSTKRLHRLWLNPEGKEPKSKLPARPRIYVKIADAMERLGAGSAESVLEQLFPDLPEAGHEAPPFDPQADQLREEFWDTWLGATERVIRENDLARVMRRASMRDWRGQIRETPIHFEFGEIADFGCPGFLSQCPHLFLGECSTGVVLPAQIFSATPNGELDEGQPLLHTESWARVWFRFWWAILPMGPSGRPRGCFLASLATQRPKWLTEPDTEGANSPPQPPTDNTDWTSLIDLECSVPEQRFYNSTEFVRGLDLDWTTGTDDGPRHCRVTLNAEAAAVIMGIFGTTSPAAPPEEGRELADPVRILKPTVAWRDRIFGLPQMGTAGWTGPLPGQWHRSPPSEPDPNPLSDENAYERAYEAFREEMVAFEEEHYAWLQRLGDYGRGDAQPVPLAYRPIEHGIGSIPTIGQQLEQSLLHLPEEDRPDTVLQRAAACLADRTQKNFDEALAERSRRLAEIRRGHP